MTLIENIKLWPDLQYTVHIVMLETKLEKKITKITRILLNLHVEKLLNLAPILCIYFLLDH